jgi:hypothetical protein
LKVEFKTKKSRNLEYFKKLKFKSNLLWFLRATSSDRDILSALQSVAVLCRGFWVVKSTLDPSVEDLKNTSDQTISLDAICLIRDIAILTANRRQNGVDVEM